MARHSISEADAGKHSERSIQTSDAKHECVAPQPDTKEVHQKSAQQLEAERQQKLHILLYKSTLPENDLNQALDELRTERRRQKVEYQGAPFADVFLVSLILSDEDSERACTVDVGDTGMSYVIPWGSIPKELQEPLHRYVSEAEGKLCGYCKEELCNSESGRMVVELYLGKQEHHVSRILY